MTSNSINNVHSVGEYPDGVVLQGYHKKFKKMKKKYFVLCADNGSNSARLEYYDTEKKFKSRSKPKRIIRLKNCFNINQRLDTKHKNVIALSTKDEAFCFVLESEQEMNKWLRALLVLQRGEDIESDPPRPAFEHVWQVQVQRKGLAEEHGIVGHYHVCLTAKSLTLLRIGDERTSMGDTRVQSIEFYLTTIRRCGDSQCYFYMEVGRHSVIGAGELWMETEDALIAQNMHKMIISRSDDAFGPMRKRSSSANEASKPISVLQRRQTHSGNKTINSSPLSAFHTYNCSATTTTTTTRIPSALTSATSNPHYPFAAPLRPLASQRRHSVSAMSTIISHQRALSLPIGDTSYVANNSNHNPIADGANNNSISSGHSYQKSLNLNNNNATTATNNIINNAPPSSSSSLFSTSSSSSSQASSIIFNNNNSHNKTKCGTTTVIHHGSTTIVSSLQPVHQRTRSLPLTEETAILCNPINSATIGLIKQANGGSVSIVCSCSRPQHVGMSCAYHACKGSPNCSLVLLPPNNNHLGGTPLGRERCDSLPSSRNRTISECSNQSASRATINTSMPPPRTIPSSANRPQSMYNRHSHSPPMNALSPSTGCSESEGSSLSIDETDSFGHSLTPDESGNFCSRYYNSRGGVILEENGDDFWYPDNKLSENEKNSTSILDKLNNHGGLTLPITTNHQITVRKAGSPASNSHVGSMETQTQYMDMCSPYSPCGSSPCEQTGSGYIPLSPGVEFPHKSGYTGSSGGHSRASSLAEETVDGYVPMGPIPSTDYIDMEQSMKQIQQQQQQLQTPTSHVSSSAASTCSITSGTPSTDMRFAEYPLEKVISRFTPDDEEMQPESEERPTRTYSVGSRLEHSKRKFRVEVISSAADQNNSRVRAYSVGSRAKVPRCDLHRGFTPSLVSCNNNNTMAPEIAPIGAAVVKGKKSSSAPILVHKSQSSVDRMSDLMEIDYSKNSDRSDSRTDSLTSPTAGSTPSRVSSFPVSVPATRARCDTFSSSPRSTASTLASTSTAPVAGYMEMKPGSYSDKSSPLPSMKSSDNGYLEMKPVAYSNSPSNLSSSPLKSMSSLYKSYANRSTAIGTNANGKPSSGDYIAMSPSSSSRPMEVDSSFSPVLSGTPEGYMEMSWSGKKSTSVEATKESKCKRNEDLKNSWSVNRSPSMPIDIKSTKEKKYVPALTLADALSRARNAVTASTADKDNSNQSTQFPFSPNSPVKNVVSGELTQRKCLVDATGGSVTILEEDSHAIGGRRVDDERKILNTDAVKKPVVEKVDALTNDYADLSLNSRIKPVAGAMETDDVSGGGDYVNYNPSDASKPKRPTGTIEKKKVNDSDGDYAIMNPSLAKPIQTTASTSTAPNKFQGFKPITSSSDDAFLRNNSSNVASERKSTSPKSALLASLNRNDKNRKSDDSGYELLHMRSDSSLLQTKRNLSRPNSVNSEKISPLKTTGHSRPNSANSECIQSISTSSSTSTLCGSSSSSSTLCGSKSQSPLSNSRPQSISDTIVVSDASVNMPEPQQNGITSRPPSVSSERELHYARLDLPVPSSSSFVSPSSSVTATTKVNCSSSQSGDSSTSPSPNANNVQQQPTFTYAQIDFNKSENLKLAMNSQSQQHQQSTSQQQQ